jgi:hypothetical protein
MSAIRGSSSIIHSGLSLLGFFLLLGCSSTMFLSQFSGCHRDLARYFKTEPIETVALGFGIRVFEELINTVSTG